MIMYSQWMRLPLVTRVGIAQAFGIAKTGPTHVIDNRVADDGYKIDALEGALTVEAMQQFLDTDEGDIATLFDGVVKRVENKEEPVGVVIDLSTPEPITEAPKAVEEKVPEPAETPKKRVTKSKAK